MPYGIVVNDKPAGILIPIDQLEKAGWIDMPDEDDLTTVTFTEDVTGLLITEAGLLVLAFVPEYIRCKSDVEDLGGTVVGLYDDVNSTASLQFVVPPKSPSLGDSKPKFPVQSPPKWGI